MKFNLNDLVDLAETRPAGKRESVLAPDVIAELDLFVDFLVKEGKSENTSRSYRSYVVTALTSDKEWDEFSSDVRSGVRAFARFRQS